jgi:type 1 glutamine amidotransferase
MKKTLALIAVLACLALSQTPPPAAVRGGRGGPPPVPKKHVLVVAQTRGWHHGSTSNGMAAFWQMGKESGIWDTELRTDMEWLGTNIARGDAHNIDYFDAVVFVNTTGPFGMDEEQKKVFIAAVRDRGMGIVGAHAALDANHANGASIWPEWTEMMGGFFQAHPWNTFDASVIVEDPTHPAVRHFPRRFNITDEMYQAAGWSRDKVNVLMRLDESKLDYSGGRGRADKDQAITWSKMYGKGRIFYSSLGHTKEAWEDPDVLKMYLEGVKWALGRTDGSAASHPKVN